MTTLFNILLKYIKPVIVFCASLFTPVAIILGCIKNPQGAVNVFIVKIIDLIHPIFPSTPANLKVAYLINQVGDQMPLVGKAVLFEIFQIISTIIGITVVIKIYKLIPFKAT